MRIDIGNQAGDSDRQHGNSRATIARLASRVIGLAR